MCFGKKVKVTEQEFFRKFYKRSFVAFLKLVEDQADKTKRLYENNYGTDIPFMLNCSIGIWPDHMKCELTGWQTACEIYFKDYGIRRISWNERSAIAEYFSDKMTDEFEDVVPVGNVKDHISRVDSKIVWYHLDYTCSREEHRFMFALRSAMRTALEKMGE